LGKEEKVYKKQTHQLICPKASVQQEKGFMTLAPGKIIIQRGRSFRYPATMQPPLTWVMFLAAKVL